MDQPDLKTRSLRAYERARLRDALLLAIPIAGVAAVGTSSWIGAVVVFVVAAALLHRGEDFGRAVLPGVLAGAIPMVMVTFSMRFGHACVEPGSCTRLCLAACAVGGVIAAAVVHLHARNAKTPRRAWMGAALVATALGGAACTCLGAMGVAAMLAGLLLGAAPRLASSAYAR